MESNVTETNYLQSTSHINKVLGVQNDEGNGTNIQPLDPVKQLVPAIIQCFGVIIIGYIAGRVKLISSTEARGLSVFVSYFALPCLVFLALVTLDFSSVNWMFLASIFIAKSIIFGVVIILSLIAKWPEGHGQAGLYGIFCVQSNDFALGYPIVMALYGVTQPQFASYLYLMAPISLVCLNPIGLVLMEFGKEKDQRKGTGNGDEYFSNLRGQTSQKKMISSSLYGILKNPIVLFTVFGLIGNVALKNDLPSEINGIFKIFSSAFSSLSLFLLGFTMVGKLKMFKQRELMLSASILIVAKILLLPIIARQTVLYLVKGNNASTTTDYANYAFLYGTFPSAPTVFIFATSYNTAVEIMACGLIMCTMISAPFIYSTAKFISVVSKPMEEYQKDMDQVAKIMMFAALTSCILTTFTMIINKKYRRIPHCYTFSLVLTLLVKNIGLIITSEVDHNNKPVYIFGDILLAIGKCGSFLYLGTIAVSILLLHCRSLCYVLRKSISIHLLSFLVLLLACIAYKVGDHKKHSVDHANELISMTDLSVKNIFVSVIDPILICIIFASIFYHQVKLNRKIRGIDGFNADSVAVPTSLKNEAVPTTSRDTTKQRLLNDHFGVRGRETRTETLVSVDWNNKMEANNDVTGGLRILNVLSESVISASRASIFGENGENHKVPTSGISVVRQCVGHNDEVSERTCRETLRRYHAKIMWIRDQSSENAAHEAIIEEEHELLSHVVIMIYACVIIFVNFFVHIDLLCACITCDSPVSGVQYQQILFENVLNQLLSILIFLLFGIDRIIFTIPVQNFWLKRTHRKTRVCSGIKQNDRQYVLDQFLLFHYDKCKSDVVHDIRYKNKLYISVFYGKELVSWLCNNLLLQDRKYAATYAQTLLDARIIQQRYNDCCFQDSVEIYRFPDLENSDAARANPGIINIE
ncbi:GPR155 (predicted) [Pycnogonum litorale]